MATDPEKVALIKEWQAPETVRQVQPFLGFEGYCWRFITGFSKIAAPLTHLLQCTASCSKTAPVEWTEWCEQAFQQLKAALVQNTQILAYADFSLPFRLYTDIILEGLGAV